MSNGSSGCGGLHAPRRFLVYVALAFALGCDDSAGGSGSTGDVGDGADGAPVASDGGATPDGSDTGDPARPLDAAEPGDGGQADAESPRPDMRAPDAGPPPPPMVLNEVQCRGEEWVEVANPTAADVSLSRWVLTDRPGDPARAFQVPPGVTVPAGGFVVLPGDGELPFGVGCDGETLVLLDPRGREVDRFDIEAHPEGTTWGRLPDGADAWQPTRPTPGAPNEAVVEIALWLNEVECRAPEWVEVFSGEDAPLDLSGWMLTDRVDDPARGYVVPGGVVLAPGGFVVLPADGAQLPFGISCGGETLALLDPGGLLVDSVVVEDVRRGSTWGRLPDGAGGWSETLATPGAANRPLPEVTVALNEVQCRGDEWVELHNHGGAPVDLTGWFVSDRPEDPERRALVPDGTILGPGEWLVLPADGALPFGVGCEDDPVVLVHALGHVVDRVVLDAPREGATGGRVPDGRGEWVEAAPTPGAANVAVVVPAVSVNEVQCRGATEWVELVNSGDVAVDVSGWTLSDRLDDPAARRVVEEGLLAPGDYLVVDLGADPPFAIGCDGDRIHVLDRGGVLLESVEVGAPGLVATWGRLPDGDGPFTDTLPTPGAANEALPAMVVELSEIDCRGRDWVELVNVGPGPADLTGWALGDAADGAGGFALDGLAIPTGGRLVVRQRVDDDDGFAFDIPCGGGTVTLVDRDGAVVDTVRVEQTAKAFTFGRLDGEWVPGLRTPGEPNADTTDEAAFLFDASRVMVVDVTVSPEAWAQLGAAPREYVPAVFQLTDGDDVYEPQDAALRVKGRAGSNRPLNRKPAFKLKFNRDDPDGRFAGLKRMTLNNMVQDPSMIHEWTAYQLFRRVGVPAPRTGYAFLRINGEDWGLYLNIEAPDDISLDRHYASTHHVYEGLYGQDLFNEHIYNMEMDQGPEEERDDLARLVELLDSPPNEGFYAATADLVDWSEVLLEMATEAYIGHWDGYAPTRNNYFFHTDDAQRLSLMPWGCDQTFRQHRDIYEGRGRLLEVCLLTPECRGRYDATMVTVLQAQFELELAPRILALAERLRPWQERDVRKEYDLARIGNEVAATVAFLEQRQTDVGLVVDCMVGPDADPDGDGFICGADCGPDDPGVHPGAAEVCGDGIDQDCNGTADDGYDCPDCVERLHGGHRYLLCVGARTYAEVAEHCREQGAQPLVINGAGENRWIIDAASAVRGRAWWTGLTDIAEEGEYVWWDGSVAGFTNWSFGEPDNAEGHEDCVQFEGFGQWSAVGCDNRAGVVCEDECEPGEDGDGDGFLRCGDDCDDSDGATNPGAEEVCGDGVDNNCNGEIDEGRACDCFDAEREGRQYRFCITGLQWAHARAECQSRGADLVVLGDAEEAAWVHRTAVAESLRDYWIGLSDGDREGEFVWVDGAGAGFTRWRDRQPDNGGGGEDCVHFRGGDGLWNDLPCDFALAFVCEAP